MDSNHLSVSIGGRNITDLRFADGIDLLPANRHELQDLTTRLEKAAGAFGMEVSSEKSKTMVTSKYCSKQPSIEMNNITLGEVSTLGLLYFF